MNKLEDMYFTWLIRKVANERVYPRYTKLFKTLYSTRFKFEDMKPLDVERAKDGKSMRYLFERRMDEYLHDVSGREFIELEDKEVNMLEMLVALASRIEDAFMGDISEGDRTSQWFWEMISNLGVGAMSDQQFNQNEYNRCLKNFFSYTYDPNGKGCIFRSEKWGMSDMAKKDIWYQMQAHLIDICKGNKFY